MSVMPESTIFGTTTAISATTSSDPHSERTPLLSAASSSNNQSSSAIVLLQNAGSTVLTQLPSAIIKRATSFWTKFMAFVDQGNAFDIAIGLILGSAFSVRTKDECVRLGRREGDGS